MGIEDKADQLKGGAKEALGNVTDNEKLANEGKADQLIGSAKEKLSEAGDAIKDRPTRSQPRSRTSATRLRTKLTANLVIRQRCR